MLARSGEITAPCPVPLSLTATIPVFQDARLQPFLDQADDALIADPMLHEADEPVFAHLVEERTGCRPSSMKFTFLLSIPTQSASSASCVPRPGRNPVTEPEEVFLVDRILAVRVVARWTIFVLQSSNR